MTDDQRRVRHPVNRWMAATLDGMVEGIDAVSEAKFMLPWSFSEEAAAEKHMAQLQAVEQLKAAHVEVAEDEVAARRAGERERLAPANRVLDLQLRRSDGLEGADASDRAAQKGLPQDWGSGGDSDRWG